MDEKKKVIEDVDKDRRYAIDASIVRIMKSRKVLGHQQLVMECVEQLGRMFKVSNPAHLFQLHTKNLSELVIVYWNTNIMQPDFKAIKKRIEDLITRDYLERDKDNPHLFRYLAWSLSYHHRRGRWTGAILWDSMEGSWCKWGSSTGDVLLPAVASVVCVPLLI